MGEERANLLPTEVGRLLGTQGNRIYALPRNSVLPSARAGSTSIPLLVLEEWLGEKTRQGLAADAADASR